MEEEDNSTFDFAASTQSGFDDSFSAPASSYGNYTMLLRRGKSRYLVAIGPHWCISAIGQAILASLGAVALYALWPLLNGFQIGLYLVFYTAVVALYFAMFVTNPGIVNKNRYVSSFNDIERKQRFACRKCCTVKEDHAFHCHDCGVCIAEHDHHCIWIGKCVGKGNLKLFYWFVASIPTFFVFVMFLSVWVTNQKIAHKA